MQVCVTVHSWSMHVAVWESKIKVWRQLKWKGFVIMDGAQIGVTIIILDPHITLCSAFLIRNRRAVINT